jgi:hypothetical protein
MAMLMLTVEAQTLSSPSGGQYVLVFKTKDKYEYFARELTWPFRVSIVDTDFRRLFMNSHLVSKPNKNRFSAGTGTLAASHCPVNGPPHWSA